MKRMLFTSIGSMVILAGVVAAHAQAADSGPVVQNSQAMAAADQSAKPTNIRQQIQDQMTKAGYTDVMVTPSSFYVRAKDKKGDPVAMVIGPDSVMEVTELPAPKMSPASPSAPTPKP